MHNMTGWFKNAIVYQIIIDRFAGCKQTGWHKPVFLGGNIKGVISKLAYLKELGVDTLWISPFYCTSAYHGYHITDFFKVEPRFGTLTDVKNLIRKVHEREMKIIADFVPNHCSWKHPYFLEAQRDRNSQYYQWFHFRKWPHNYTCFLIYEELPKINLGHIPARDHIIQAAKYWLSLGFDGYRLDHVAGPKHTFWKHFRKEMKRDYPDAVLIGEAWLSGVKLSELRTMHLRGKYWKWLMGSASDALLKSYVGELDGVLDFRFQVLMKRFIAEKKWYKPRWLLEWQLNRHFARYPEDFFLATFLDNHDMDRFLFQCANDKEKLKEAARIQFSIDQPKVIYNGTEAGMTQKKRITRVEYSDLQARQPMRWKPDKRLLSFYEKLIKSSKVTNL